MESSRSGKSSTRALSTESLSMERCSGEGEEGALLTESLSMERCSGEGEEGSARGLRERVDPSLAIEKRLWEREKTDNGGGREGDGDASGASVDVSAYFSDCSG